MMVHGRAQPIPRNLSDPANLGIVMPEQDQSGSHARSLDEGRQLGASSRDFLLECLTGDHRGRSGCATARRDHAVKDPFGQGDQAQHLLHGGGHVTVLP
jgi:hypothetical protein